jgi:hypothetical protein
MGATRLQSNGGSQLGMRWDLILDSIFDDDIALVDPKTATYFWLQHTTAHTFMRKVHLFRNRTWCNS